MDLRAWNSPSPNTVDAINGAPAIVRLYDNGEVKIYLSGLG